MDVLTPEQRRKCMSNVRHEDTPPERYFRKILWHAGFRYRKNWRSLPGTPDIAITKYKIAIFIDGEFWHGKSYDGGDYAGHKYHSLKEQLSHGSHAAYWTHKIERNMQRDLQVEAELNGLGWTVLRFWSKDVMKHTDLCLIAVREAVFDKQLQT